MYKIIFSLILTLILSEKALSLSYNQAEVESIHSPDSRPCTFLKLKNVAVADATIANSPWFTIPLDHNGHDVILSILLTAYSTGKKINVVTSGTTKCSHPEISSIHFSY